MQLSAAETAVAAAVANTGASTFSIFLAFVAGGLFFSTVAAAVGAIFIFGRDNVQRAFREVRLVVRRTLSVLRLAVAAAWATLFADDKQWRMAIRELRKGFAKAKQTASEGVEAISLQRDLFAAAVGIPGLPLQQYIVDRLYAEQRYLAVALEDACRETCKGVRNSRVKRLTLRKFDAGAVPPKLIAARAYDATDALAFDVEMRWTSELTAEMEMTLAGPLGARVPVSVRNLRFEGPVRLVATPLVNVAPGFGALLISLPSAPRIGLDVSVAGGEVTKLPWLRDEIVTAMQANIADELLWPRRLVLDQKKPTPSPQSLLARAQLEKLATDDPLLQAEKALEAQPAVSALQKARRKEPSKLNALLDILVKTVEPMADTAYGI